jgi:hypothetical protein
MLWAIEERCDEMEWKIVIFYAATVACRRIPRAL